MMLRPSYRLTIGEKIIDTSSEPKASTAVDIDVRLDMDTPVDGFTIEQGQVGGFSPEPGDDVSIELGYADTDFERVITGLVTDVTPDFETKRIFGMSTGDLLSRHRRNETFEALSAGEIVKNLAASAGLKIDRIDDGVTLPAYVVDGRRSTGDHVRDLAELSGYDSYVNADGELVFEEFAGQRTAHSLRYGEHVIDVEVRRTRSDADKVEVWGESPGSSRGTESWAWLTKNFEPWRGTAGSGDAVRLLERSAVRTAESAIAMATRNQVILERNKLRGTVRIQGRPSVHLGELLRLEEFPLDDLNRNYQVRSVNHRITKAGGFVTTIGFRTTEALTP